MSTPADEASIDAKLKEIDSSIAGLQKTRQELLQAKKALRPKTAAAQPESPPATTLSEKALERKLNMLEWRAFKKKDGEWTFLRDMKGSLVQDLEGATEFVDQLRKGKQLVVGKYRYSASEDKFLSRYFAESD
jgi:hypothetical protein